MRHKRQYIQLFIATAGGLITVAFVTLYSLLIAPIICVRQHLRYEQFPAFCSLLLHYSWCAILVPIVLLVLGIILLRGRRPSSWFEAVVGAQWLFALAWFAFCLLTWALPEAPYQEIIR